MILLKLMMLLTEELYTAVYALSAPVKRSVYTFPPD
jgi:hypothetical protein